MLMERCGWLGPPPCLFRAMDIFLRPPSTSWEPVALPDVPGAAVWAWFRPPAVPCGIVFQIPEQTHLIYPGAVTVRRLLHALGLDCRLPQGWLVCGTLFDGMSGANPHLDQSLHQPAEGVDPTVAVYLPQPLTHVATPAAVFDRPVMRCNGGGSFIDAQTEAHYHAMENDWHAIEILESKLLQLRHQMNGELSKLMALNRDLTPEERNASDMQEHRDWQEARRLIRDGAGVLSRGVRVHDVGITTAATKRNQLNYFMANFIAPRRPLENLAQVQHQFETYRKAVQLLLTEMQSAMHGPAHEGQSKAMTVLNRVRGKLQRTKSKR